ncbi:MULTISPECIES: response regulator transcription factor [unclassified Marinobacter]|uniref:response regulator transcription factor n=1 Tax=unclassified Marinobacter TaxID=83889 RepID=UPI001926DDDD|nr:MULTISPECIES: helix-turn-helix transcriptional regulator [unclassified Marinobacter]MBL3825126.1 helix-turn-helix transcriptional regulator [Marinobacter sp. MC3]MBL3893670.1 helix-turn-helix transcriptional regulator [Marinobacter sp. MW3]
MPRTIKQYPHSEVELANQEGLSQRKSEILYLAAQGLTEKEIAAELDISPETAKAHLNSLRNQFNAVNRVDLVSQAWAHGVLQAATKNVRMSLLRRISESIAVPPTSAIDHQFYRAQSRNRTRQSVGVSLGQKAVAPVFKEASAGEADYFDIPTVFRNRLHRSIEDLEARDKQRLIAYTHQASERLASMDKQEIAA